MSNSSAEVDGLDDLLTAPEQHLYDVALAREQRRSRLGYAAPADARAFLALARQPHQGINPVGAAYFRALDDDEADTGPARAPRPGATDTNAGSPHGNDSTPPSTDDAAASVDAVLELLAEAGVTPEGPRALLEAAEPGPRAVRLALLRRLMQFVLRHDEAAYVRRSRELAFLANVLVAGCSVQSRPFTPQEASDAAASICNLGLESWFKGDLDTGVPPDAFLADHDLVAAFETGWSVLHQDVCLNVADQLLSALALLHPVDAETRRGLGTLERELARQRAAGTPWRAREFADVLATLDRAAWRSVVGLLGECPILPAALTTVLGGRATAANSTAFEFIATTAQIGDVRAYLQLLPGLLSR